MSVVGDTVRAVTTSRTAAAAPLAGHQVAITGAMTGPLTGLRRQEMMRLLREAGAATACSVSGRTTLLVTSRDHTRKTRRAASLGVRTIGPGELAELLGYPALF